VKRRAPQADLGRSGPREARRNPSETRSKKQWKGAGALVADAGAGEASSVELVLGRSRRSPSTSSSGSRSCPHRQPSYASLTTFRRAQPARAFAGLLNASPARPTWQLIQFLYPRHNSVFLITTTSRAWSQPLRKAVNFDTSGAVKIPSVCKQATLQSTFVVLAANRPHRESALESHRSHTSICGRREIFALAGAHQRRRSHLTSRQVSGSRNLAIRARSSTSRPSVRSSDQRAGTKCAPQMRRPGPRRHFEMHYDSLKLIAP